MLMLVQTILRRTWNVQVKEASLKARNSKDIWHSTTPACRFRFLQCLSHPRTRILQEKIHWNSRVPNSSPAKNQSTDNLNRVVSTSSLKSRTLKTASRSPCQRRLSLSLSAHPDVSPVMPSTPMECPLTSSRLKEKNKDRSKVNWARHPPSNEGTVNISKDHNVASRPPERQERVTFDISEANPLKFSKEFEK